MEIIPVSYEGRHAYDIRIDDGPLWEGLELAACKGRRIMIVSDETVAPLYADSLSAHISGAGIPVSRCVLPGGEAHKTPEQILQIYEALLEARLDRHDILIALGGGVIGDMAGFAAATYLRGISFIQVPTTLLAQTDSSVGGKTGVDFRGYKNIVGAFHMPSQVYIHPQVLQTLPDRELSCGMAEVIKGGLIRDEAFFSGLKQLKEAVFQRDITALTGLIAHSCRIKKDIVERDPKEAGERMLLNFGHTIGHAVEKACGFQKLHGECVSLGCVCAAEISRARGLLDAADTARISEMLALYGLPIAAADLPQTETILSLIKSDKKMDAGRIRFVLLQRIGEAFTTDSVTDAEIAQAIDFIRTAQP